MTESREDLYTLLVMALKSELRRANERLVISRQREKLYAALFRRMQRLP